MVDIPISIITDKEAINLNNVSNNGIITLHRGDNFSIPLYINFGHQLDLIRYKLKENEKVFFALLEPNQPFEEALLKKTYTKDDLNKYNDVIIKITSEDTINLIPGTYYYEIKLESFEEDGSKVISTIVPRTIFYIV